MNPEKKKQFEERGLLTTENFSAERLFCNVGLCKMSYGTSLGYLKHLRNLHPEVYEENKNKSVCRTEDITYAAEASTSNPLTNQTDQTINEVMQVERSADLSVYATAWSIVRVGYEDTFCEKVKAMVEMQRTFYSPVEPMCPIDNINKNTCVTRDPFRKAIALMAANIKQQLLQQIKLSPFYSLYIGESIDCNSYSHLLVIVRYKDKDELVENLLFSQKINPQPMENYIFVTIETVIRNNELNWENCVGISMDGERATAGPLKNFVKCFEKNYSSIPVTYILTRRGEFIKNNLTASLNVVLNDTIKLVNEFKSCPILKLSDKIDLKFKNLLIHTHDNWLSYGHTSLLENIFDLARERKVPDHNLFQLAFLIDIIDHFERLNTNLQNQESTIFHINDQISEMYGTLYKYRHELSNNNFKNFPNLQKMFDSVGMISTDIKSEMKCSLKLLQKSVIKYLTVPDDERADLEWIRKPFDTENSALFTTRAEIIEWNQFKTRTPTIVNPNNLESFWIKAHQKYPIISERAIKFLTIFKNSHFYETGFAAFVDIRASQATDFNNEDNYLRIKLSPIKPQL